jgi:hypothetical protein
VGWKNAGAREWLVYQLVERGGVRMVESRWRVGPVAGQETNKICVGITITLWWCHQQHLPGSVELLSMMVWRDGVKMGRVVWFSVAGKLFSLSIFFSVFFLFSDLDANFQFNSGQRF